jgi:hypothetical protein
LDAAHSKPKNHGPTASLVSVAKLVELILDRLDVPMKSAHLYHYATEFANASRLVFDTGRHLPGSVCVAPRVENRGFCSTAARTSVGIYRRTLPRRRERLIIRAPMIMRLLDRGADKQREALGAFGTAALHVATAHQHRNAPLDAGTEALALLECRRSFVSLASRRLAAAAPRCGHHRVAQSEAMSPLQAFKAGGPEKSCGRHCAPDCGEGARN